MKNSEAKPQLGILYGLRCLLTNIEAKKLDYHHIEKAEWGGIVSIENGALLIKPIHEWLHNDIELHDIELFYLINECLKLYKKCIDENKIELIEQYEKECMPIFRQKIKK